MTRILIGTMCATLALVQVAARPARDRVDVRVVQPADVARAVSAALVVGNERTLVTDPRQLVAMGFPADADNVYVHASVLANLKPVESPTDDFGFGAGSHYTSIPAKAFIGRNNTAASPWEYTGGNVSCCFNLSRTGAETFADAPFDVPPGVAIQSVRYWAHDVDAANDMAFFVFEACLPSFAGGATAYTLIAQGGTTGSSGFQGDVLTGTGLTVRTRDCTYQARVRFDGTAAMTFQNLRVEWRRQVSPAPGVATFVDVPTTHFFFRWIEALAASGITAGCGPGPTYCPDNPVTRAQMAVFLSVALGLHAQ